MTRGSDTDPHRLLNDPNLISEVEVKMSESSADNNDPTLKIENIILNVWDSLPNNFVSNKKFANALLTIFGFTHSCEKLIYSMNFVKSSIEINLAMN